MSNVFKQTERQRKYQEKFIEKANLIHGDKYDYSLVEYVNAKTKVCIICKKHGEFWQTPDNHTHKIRPAGCPKCVLELQVQRQSMTNEEFIKHAKEVHFDKDYDYSQVKYKNNHTKIKIICMKHGIFEQKPKGHLKGQGCPMCGVIKNIKSRSLNTKEWIIKAKEVHGDEYDYSKVKYVNTHKKVTIICHIHGEFCQTPAAHLKGQGCPMCGDLRRVKHSNYNSGLYHIKKPNKYSGNDCNIIYRSSYELKAFQMIEEDKNILKWGSETVVVPYELDGKQHKYIVDLKLETEMGIQLIEIKPYSKTIKPKNGRKYDIEEFEMNIKKWKAAKRYCKERNWEFEIWTEKELGI